MNICLLHMCLKFTVDNELSCRHNSNKKNNLNKCFTKLSLLLFVALRGLDDQYSINLLRTKSSL